MAMHLKSAAFHNGGKLPKRFTLDGENISPPLDWFDIPPEAQSLAVFCDDPDAPHGTFHHWAVFDIPADCRGLPEGFHSDGAVSEGINDYGKKRYDGAHPPHGPPHHYRFTIMALDVDHLDVEPAARCYQLEALAQDHCLAEAKLVGRYKR